MGKTANLALLTCVLGMIIGAAIAGAAGLVKVNALNEAKLLQEEITKQKSAHAQGLIATLQALESERAADLNTIAELQTRVRELEAKPTPDTETREVASTPVHTTATTRNPERGTPRGAEDDAAESEKGVEDRDAAVAEMTETVARVRGNIQTFYDTQLANTTDPDRQERLLALSEYANHGLDLRMQINQATDPAEKQELFLDLRVTYANHDQYLRAEQAAQLIDTAAILGITDPAQQDAFVDAVNQTIRDPFFNQNAPQLGGRGVPVPVQR